MPIKSNLKDFTQARLKFSQKVRLLSGMYYARDKFPTGEIVVYPWDHSTDEFVAKKQKEMWDFIPKIADLQGMPVSILPVGDVLTILLVSRAIRSNSEVEYRPVCTNCNRVLKKEKIAIPTELGRVGEKSLTYTGTDLIILPEIKDEVAIRPRTVADEQDLTEKQQNDRQLNVVPSGTLRVLQSIVTIGGEKPDTFAESLQWFNALPPADVSFLENSQDQLDPHLDLNISHTCDFCNFQFFYPLDLDRDFFRRGLR